MPFKGQTWQRIWVKFLDSSQNKLTIYWNVSYSFFFVHSTHFYTWHFTRHHEYTLNQNTGNSHFCFSCARICFPALSLNALCPPYLNFDISKFLSEKKVKQQFLWNKERDISSERWRTIIVLLKQVRKITSYFIILFEFKKREVHYSIRVFNHIEKLYNL